MTQNLKWKYANAPFILCTKQLHVNTQIPSGKKDTTLIIDTMIALHWLLRASKLTNGLYTYPFKISTNDTFTVESNVNTRSFTRLDNPIIEYTMKENSGCIYVYIF